jgi:hypothetical protein
MFSPHENKMASRLRAAAAQIAERERHVAEAVREKAAEVAYETNRDAWSPRNDAIAKAIRALELTPILNPEKST